MQKPTSTLNIQIIEYLMRQSQVRSLLDARDQHNRTFGTEIHCKFFKRNPRDAARSAYIVDFVYEVDNERLEQTDDVSVAVEVREGSPPSFEIIDIRKY